MVEIENGDIVRYGRIEIRPFDLDLDWVSLRNGGSTIESFLKAVKDSARAVIFDFKEKKVIILYE